MEDLLQDKEELQEIIAEFITESVELIESASRDLVQMEKSPSPQAINSVFRSVHTIKGTAGFLGYNELSSLAHKGEDVLGKIRKGELHLTPDIISTLLTALDVMRLLIEDIGSEAKDPRNIAGLLRELDAIVPGVAEPGPRAAKKGLEERSTDEPPGMHQINEANALPEEADAERRQSFYVPSNREQTVRVEVKKLDELMNLVGELVLRMNRLTLIRTLFREGNIRQTELEGLAEVSNHIEMITNDLQSAVMKVRLVSISRLFNKVPRLVRDLCSECGKEVELSIEVERRSWISP